MKNNEGVALSTHGSGATKAELESTSTKIFYGLGSIAFGVKDNGFQTILLPFYNLVLHVPAQLVGLAIFIAFACDAVMDPVIGQISDNLRTRWGRRHPLMYMAAPLVAVSYLLLWNPPHWSNEALFYYLIVCAIVVRTFITLYEIPSSALVPELTADYDQRTSFSSYRVFFAWYGGMTMQVLALFVFLRPDATHAVGQLNPAGYSTYGYVAAIVMFGAIIISALGTHRFIPHFRAPERRHLSLAQYGKEMLATLNNPAFLILMIASLFLNFATGLVFALNFYISTFFWMFNSNALGVLALALFVSVLLAFFIAPPISKKFGKKRGAIGMFMIGFVIANTPITLGLLGIIGPQTPDLLAILFGFSIVSAALTIGCSIMIAAMIADVVEDSELKTGRRSEGLFFAGSSLLQKAVTGLGVFGSGMLLSLTNFPTTAQPGHVDPGIVHHFAVVYVLANGFFYIVGFIILGYFPIDRKSHADNLTQLAAEAAQASEPVDLGVEP